MSKQIKYDKLHKSEKRYRVSVIVAYVFVAIAVFSCVFTIPDIDLEKSTTPLLAVYAVAFVLYVLALLACGIEAVIAFKKTNKEVLAIQAIMLFIATAFVASNVKMFTTFFLFGIGKDSMVEKLFGSDMNALTESFSTSWTMLIIGFFINMLLAVLSISKLASKKN